MSPSTSRAFGQMKNKHAAGKKSDRRGEIPLLNRELFLFAPLLVLRISKDYIQGVPKSEQVLESFISGPRNNVISCSFNGNDKQKFKILYAEKNLQVCLTTKVIMTSSNVA